MLKKKRQNDEAAQNTCLLFIIDFLLSSISLEKELATHLFLAKWSCLLTPGKIDPHPMSSDVDYMPKLGKALQDASIHNVVQYFNYFYLSLDHDQTRETIRKGSQM